MCQRSAFSKTHIQIFEVVKLIRDCDMKYCYIMNFEVNQEN